MSAFTGSDPLIRALAQLPAVQPNAGRAEAVRGRCRAVLEGQSATTPLASLEPVAVGVACAVYGWQLARLASLLAR